MPLSRKNFRMKDLSSATHKPFSFVCFVYFVVPFFFSLSN